MLIKNNLFFLSRKTRFSIFPKIFCLFLYLFLKINPVMMKELQNVRRRSCYGVFSINLTAVFKGKSGI